MLAQCLKPSSHLELWKTCGERMKKVMSGFDLGAMARELNGMRGAYVKKAYMPHYEQIVLRINPKVENNGTWSLFEGSGTPRNKAVRCP